MVGLEITEDVYFKDIRSQTTCDHKIKSLTSFFLIICPGAIDLSVMAETGKTFLLYKLIGAGISFSNEKLIVIFEVQIITTESNVTGRPVASKCKLEFLRSSLSKNCR